MVHRRFILAGGLAALSTGLVRAQTPAREQASAPAGKRPSFRLEEANEALDRMRGGNLRGSAVLLL